MHSFVKKVIEVKVSEAVEYLNKVKSYIYLDDNNSL